MQRLIEDAGIGLLVTFDEEPTEAQIEEVKEVCRWVAEDHSRINVLLPKASMHAISRAEAEAPADEVVETMNRLRRSSLS